MIFAKIGVWVIGLQFEGLERSPDFGITVTIPLDHDVGNIWDKIEALKIETKNLGRSVIISLQNATVKSSIQELLYKSIFLVQLLFPTSNQIHH